MPTAEQVFHTRGLTLSQEYRQIRTVVRTRSAGRAAPFYAISPELTRVAGPSRCEVGDPCPCLRSLLHALWCSVATAAGTR